MLILAEMDKYFMAVAFYWKTMFEQKHLISDTLISPCFVFLSVNVVTFTMTYT